MGWKSVHRWLGLALGTLAMVLGLSGALLAFDPVQQAWQAPGDADTLPVAALVQRVQQTIPGIEEVRRLPSGVIVVYSFEGDQARAVRIDPADGAVLGPYQASALPRWVKNLHRTLLAGDTGRWGAALTALAMLVLSGSGLVLLLRRMGGWRRLGARVRGTLAQRVHVVTGRIVLAVLLLTSVTALYMSSTTLGLVSLDAAPEPEVASAVTGQGERAAGDIALLRQVALQDLRALNFPNASDPEDAWKLTTRDGATWLDRYSGEPLATQPATAAQQLYNLALMLHAGEGAWWFWAVVLGLAGASVPLFWVSGVLIWWRARQDRPRITNNSAPAQADMLIFVASEGGSTWGFAQALHDALVRAGHRVHSAPLEQFQAGPGARQVFVLAATYGEGQAPAHASGALARIAALKAGAAPVTVLGFGDRQFPAYCAFANELDALLRERGWPALLPLERIHQQSAQQFARWGEALANALGEALTLDYRPRLPATTALTLVSRQDYAGIEGQSAVILRFAWPAQSAWDRLRGRGLARFAAGDLIAIVPPGSPVPRYYSLASGSEDGFVEICVRHLAGGLCSSHLIGLQPGEQVQAFIRENPGFALPASRRPVLLIGAGTGVAPLAGFIRRNDRRAPMHLWFGARDPARDYYFRPEIERWQGEGRVASVRTAFSRVPDGGGYVQDALRRDAERVRSLIARGALVRVCGSRPMARGVAETLDTLLSALGLSVAQLKARGRYAEDVF